MNKVSDSTEFLTDSQRDALYDACVKVHNEQTPELREANRKLFLDLVSAVWKEADRLLFLANLQLEARWLDSL